MSADTELPRFSDVHAMHSGLRFVSWPFCVLLAGLAPLLTLAGALYHFSLNQTLRVVDYVLPPYLALVAQLTLVLALG